MRVVWKDSNAVGQYKDIRYRKHTISGYNGIGWVIDIPGDNNIYRTNYHAMNALDKVLGGRGGVRGEACEKRKRYGIEIIGQRNDKTG